jgi:hypothetical protein
VAQDEGNLLPRAQVGEPVPGVNALDAGHDIAAEGGNGFEDGFGAGGEVAVEDDLAAVVQDAEVHRPGVRVDVPVESVWLRVESHRGLAELGR